MSRYTVYSTADCVGIMDRQEHRPKYEWDLCEVFDQYQRMAMERCEALNQIEAARAEERQ
jgi:hypothetical protein